MHCLFILFQATIVPVRQAVKNYQFWQPEFSWENKNHCPGREQLSSECKSPSPNEALAASDFHDKTGAWLLVGWFPAPGHCLLGWASSLPPCLPLLCNKAPSHPNSSKVHAHHPRGSQGRRNGQKDEKKEKEGQKEGGGKESPRIGHLL